MKQLNIYAFAFCFFFLLLATNTYAEITDQICQEKQNKIVCGKGDLDQVRYLDDVIFNGTNIKGHTKIIGDVNANHTHFNTLDITGDFKGEDSVIDGNAKITGDLRFNNISFHADTNITGDLKATKAQFLKHANIVGDLTCDFGQFESDLTLSTSIASFSNTTTKNITFNSNPKQQTLYLKSSTVHGNIQFLSNNGVIYLSENSSINGKVSGGKVINQSF